MRTPRVSRALNGYPEVSAKTRERVIRAAKIHNYRPNRRARSLATGRSRRVAIVTGSGTGQGWMDPVFCAFLSGAAEVLERENFEWVVRHSKSAKREVSSDAAWDFDGFEGAILAAPTQDDYRFVERAPGHFPIVVRGQMRSADQSVCGLDFDHDSAIGSAIRSLAGHGHRRIALVTGPRERLQSQAQITAYLNAMRDMGLPVSNGWVQSGASTQQFGLGVVDDYRGMSLSPTAVVIGCSIVATGVAARLPRNRPHAANTPRFVYFDDGLTWANASVNESCFGIIKTPSVILGEEAAERLLRQIREPETLPDVRLLAPEFRLVTSPTSEKPGAYSQPDAFKATHGNTVLLDRDLTVSANSNNA